jgi:hypothetical protein
VIGYPTKQKLIRNCPLEDSEGFACLYQPFAFLAKFVDILHANNVKWLQNISFNNRIKTWRSFFSPCRVKGWQGGLMKIASMPFFSKTSGFSPQMLPLP